jgi:hypothetical protein
MLTKALQIRRYPGIELWLHIDVRERLMWVARQLLLPLFLILIGVKDGTCESGRV